ncbi:WXG100 family type VII secretion target [Streptomyces kasugaensis]|uniref:WXG100 family type VII secretion target n=1 Tax=Streptomyces kasugaensis TaxID=1946 RepID=A0A4Q9HKN7_STRKA|nr:WXG100 family type VII secretion target [Streptomyces kasugaensis]TBO55282.1 WXG100 family type VII secretion target [Streptomyces kasugaensis]
MSAGDKVKEIVQDLTGMWWPEGDEDELREAARAWRTFAEDVKDITSATHKSAQDVIDNNKGKSIDAFETFWRKYHGGGKGYLDDLASAAEDMAKALDKFADQIAEAKKKIEHELEIAGAVLVAGTALAIFTGGISEVAAVGATEAIVAAASTAGLAVSATVAEIAGTVLATAAIGGIEAITVDVVVAQGGRNLLGDQRGINLAEIKDAGVTGVLLGGALGGAGRAAKAVGDAGGVKNAFGKMKLDGLGNFKNPLRDFEISMPHTGGPRLAMAGEGPADPAGRPFLMRNTQGGGGGGRASWTASDTIPGPARGKTLRAPHPRHTMGGVKSGEVKAENSLILPEYRQAVDKDIAGIAAGKAKWDHVSQRYEINGRTYGIEDTGTVFPDSGPGIVSLDRVEYDALKQITRVDGDISKLEKLFSNAPKFKNNPQAVEKALELYRTYH